MEDQTSFPKKNADTWGAKLVGEEYVGPNLLGRLLMELREQKQLDYTLPIEIYESLVHLFDKNVAPEWAE